MTLQLVTHPHHDPEFQQGFQDACQCFEDMMLDLDSLTLYALCQVIIEELTPPALAHLAALPPNPSGPSTDRYRMGSVCGWMTALMARMQDSALSWKPIKTQPARRVRLRLVGRKGQP